MSAFGGPCRGNSPVECFSEKEKVVGSTPTLGTKSGYRIVAIISPCHGEDTGSTPVTRSKMSENSQKTEILGIG
jgi:hypothetical protein